ncbi:MAG: HEPN domain-containing protein [bacterium]
MNEELVKHYIMKADNDLKTAKDELETDKPATDTVCFHTQQCVEKYLKAYLVFKGKEILKSLKSHNIEFLIVACRNIDNSFNYLIEINAHELTDYAIELRYPDDFYMPSVEESNQAIATAEKVREFILNKLKNGKL